MAGSRAAGGGVCWLLELEGKARPEETASATRHDTIRRSWETKASDFSSRAATRPRLLPSTFAVFTVPF